MQSRINHKFLLLFYLSCFSFLAKAQTDLKSFNLFGGSGYFIKGELQADNIYHFTLSKNINAANDDTNVSFSLRPMTKEAFTESFFIHVAKFKEKLKKAGNTLPNAAPLKYNVAFNDSLKSKDYKLLEEEASRLFYIFVSGSIIIDDLDNKPLAGKICYFDTIKILRRDFNDKFLRKRIRQFWRKYKEDKNTEVKDLKERIYDNEEAFSDSDFVDLNAELGKDLNRKEFIRKKSDELLQSRANQRQKKYEDALKELNLVSIKLKQEENKTLALTSSKDAIDSIIALEKKRKVLFKELIDTFSILKGQHMELGWLPERIKNSISKNKNSFANKIDTAALKNEIRQLLDYTSQDLLYCLIYEGVECALDNCKNYKSILEATIEKERSLFNKTLESEEKALKAFNDQIIENADNPISENEEEALEDVSPKRNVEEIRDNILALKSIIQLYDEIQDRKNRLYRNLPIFCKKAKAINQLNEEQVNFINQINVGNLKEDLLQVWPTRKDNLRQNGTKIVIEEEINQDFSRSDKIISELETKKEEIAKQFEDIEKNLKTIKSDVSKFQKDSKIAEDQLIYKQFAMESIVLEINEGFIENILMVGTVDEFADKYGNFKVDDGKVQARKRILKFENLSPIGFSRKLDFDAIKEKKLYTRGGRRTHYEAYLEDILSIYIQDHQVGRRDYSPSNQIVTLENASKNASLCKDLYKESTYRLFEAQIYSDFVGLDASEPNGLIQTEINKRINLLTSRVPFRSFSWGGVRNEWNIGFLSFLEPSLVLSKIEDNNRYLELSNKDRFINNQYEPIKFTSTLSLKQFENFSAGADANLLLLDMPNLKSTLYFNWGFRYGRTAIRDSIRTLDENGDIMVDDNGVKEFGVNTFSHSPEMVWSIFEDERYGFSISWQHHWFYLRDNRFEQVANIATFQDLEINPPKNVNEFNTIRILTYLEPTTNNKGRLFFRYTYNWQQGFWRTGFHQAQVGYSFFLLGRQAE